jgi:hypothetical protein
MALPILNRILLAESCRILDWAELLFERIKLLGERHASSAGDIKRCLPSFREE